MITEADNGNHYPAPGDDERWQESWFLMWVDPEQRAGGFHHLSQWRNKGICDVWSWTALEGEVIGKYQHLALPIPDADLSDLQVGGLTIRTREPLRSFDFTATYPDCRSAIAYAAFKRHVEEYVLSPAGASIGDNHYESFGLCTGTVEHGGRTIPVEGIGFADHSWGPREMGKLLTERSVLASFGEDLYAQILTWTTTEGMTAFGYVCENGVAHRVTTAETNMVIADDGHTPLRADITVRCGRSRAYRLQAEGFVSSVTSAQEGFFITDTLSEFTCGGHVGSGLIEAMNLRAPAPWHRELLGLDTEAGGRD